MRPRRSNVILTGPAKRPGGDPIGERFMLWNFVNSSKERIEQAKEDWTQERMKLPNADDKEVTSFSRGPDYA
ncbi:MAG: pirin-like C-terminal cupin domain-containing protein [Pseudomonadota bacterium]